MFASNSGRHSLRHPARWVVALAGIAFCTALLFPGVARSEKEPRALRVVITDLQSRGVEPYYAAALTDMFCVEADGLENVEMICKGEIEALLDVQQLQQLLGCVGSGCMTELGGKLGADRVVYGAIAKVGRTHMVVFSLLDVERGRAVKRSSRRVRGEIDDLLDQIPAAVTELFQPVQEEEPEEDGGEDPEDAEDGGGEERDVKLDRGEEGGGGRVRQHRLRHRNDSGHPIPPPILFDNDLKLFVDPEEPDPILPKAVFTFEDDQEREVQLIGFRGRPTAARGLAQQFDRFSQQWSRTWQAAGRGDNEAKDRYLRFYHQDFECRYLKQDLQGWKTLRSEEFANPSATMKVEVRDLRVRLREEGRAQLTSLLTLTEGDQKRTGLLIQALREGPEGRWVIVREDWRDR